MKYLVMLMFLALTFLYVRSQPCLPEGIVFTTQTEIDNFQNNYPNCSEIEGYVTIGEQTSSSNINNLEGLSVITSVGEYLEIRLNDYLVNLNGLHNITAVGGTFSVVSNDSLVDLSGLEQLSEIGGDCYIGYNKKLKSLAGMDNLTGVEGTVDIRENDSLETLTGIENLETIGGGLDIRANARLLSIAELDALNAVGDHIWINGNFLLTTLEGLEGLSEITGYLNVTYNNSLADLSGLDNITSVGGYLEVGHDDMLESLSGLENLTTIGDYLNLYFNASLADLSALGNLTEIGGELRVSSNDILSSLEGLQNIDAGSISDLYLHNNPALTICEVESVCNYLAAPNGAIYITSNASGCNNQQEVEAACESISVEETTWISGLTLHPNPFSTSIGIEYRLVQPALVLMRFYNPFGEQVDVIELQQSTGPQQVIWAPDLPKGIYYFSLQTGDQVSTGKVVLVK
ncbi:MAG: T9SS type A sorting domain-containing protein [bacterium]